LCVPVDAAIRPWRTATFVAASIALLELVGLVVVLAVLFGGPLTKSVRHHAAANSAAAAVSPRAPARIVRTPAVARLSRAHTHVLVLNGNGRSGAAADQALSLETLGYAAPATGNAKRANYVASIVMYRPGYRSEASRLARDAGIKVVSPLDGLRAADLKGSQLALIVGT
jgi:LytR cell envelope-related transcriptional attenuator